MIFLDHKVGYLPCINLTQIYLKMKGVLFFLGTVIRSMAIKPSQFFYFHGYILLIYLITYLAEINSLGAYKLIFTIGVTGPLLLAIYRGLPLDCLNYEKAILKESGNSVD